MHVVILKVRNKIVNNLSGSRPGPGDEATDALLRRIGAN
jgi:hypothetical protein